MGTNLQECSTYYNRSYQHMAQQLSFVKLVGIGTHNHSATYQ